jgi:hypothetical protein
MGDVLTLTRPGYTIQEDDRCGIIRMRVYGFFDIPTLERHFAENDAVVRRWRTHGRLIRVLIEAVELLPHSPEGQACVQASTARIYAPGDRVAVLVSSSLVKMQMRRALRQGDLIDFFVSEKAAMAWLAGR